MTGFFVSLKGKSCKNLCGHHVRSTSRRWVQTTCLATSKTQQRSAPTRNLLPVAFYTQVARTEFQKMTSSPFTDNITSRAVRDFWLNSFARLHPEFCLGAKLSIPDTRTHIEYFTGGETGDTSPDLLSPSGRPEKATARPGSRHLPSKGAESGLPGGHPS